MAEAEGSLFARFSGYSRQPIARQLALLVGLAASIAMAIGLVQWAVQPNYKPLFGQMAPEDTNQVISSLEAAGIDYTLDRRTGMVAVPAGDIHRARLSLASDGYPRNDGVGFESLYREQEIGLSSFMEQARFHRALEAELSRTIASMDVVRGARVHLAMTKQSAFLRQREQPAASVMLSLYAGRNLTDRQLSGVINLVASSVPNLEAGQVSVVDQQGKLLSKQGMDDDMGYSQEQFGFRRQIEEDYGRRIVALLEPILGEGSVRAQVTADIDFTRVERTSESYSPDARIRSEQTSEETSTQGDRNGGIPGTLSNEPPLDSGVAVTQPNADPALGTVGEVVPPRPTRTSRQSTVNYEMDKTISHIQETPGTLQRLSIAVVLNHVETTADDGSVSTGPLPQARIDEVTSLVREAVGFNEVRGDTVSVISASFIEPAPIEEVAVETSILEQDWVWQIGKGVMALVVLLALIFGVLRPVMKFSAVPVVPPPATLGGPQAMAALGAPGVAGGMADDQVTLGLPGAQAGLPAGVGDATGYQQQLMAARNVAAGEPERAAYVVRNWVAADG